MQVTYLSCHCAFFSRRIDITRDSRPTLRSRDRVDWRRERWGIELASGTYLPLVDSNVPITAAFEAAAVA